MVMLRLGMGYSIFYPCMGMEGNFLYSLLVLHFQEVWQCQKCPLESQFSQYDPLEGLSYWYDPFGKLALTPLEI